MATYTRRELAIASLGSLALPGLAAGKETGLSSKVYTFGELPVRHSGKLTYRPILSGKAIGGCKFAIHESSLAPHSEPHPPHHHTGEEMFMVLHGELEVTINGNSSRIKRGSVAFIGSEDEHGIRNPLDVPAKYYVIEFGSQGR